MTFLRSFLLSLIILLLLLVAFIAGYFFSEQQIETNAPELPILKEASSILLQHGLKDPPPDPELEYGMIRGMLQAYDDPYTSFVEPAQQELQSNALEGRFGGIGVQLIKDLESYWVLVPIPDSPAAKAGIQESDRLLAVEGKPIDKETPADAVQSAIRGPVGEKIVITVGRAPDYTPQDYAIERAEIALPSVTWHLAPGEASVGVIKVNLMGANTADEIQSAVADLRQRGAKYFVLDLRDNPGGYLTAGVDIARLFLEDGVVMQQQYRGQDVETYKVEKPGALSDIPLAVLINQGSASAAEIAAGAIQAQKRAPLIGTHSFGKDTIQLVFLLQDQSSLHVTSARWWIPGLEPPLGGVGLQPDIPIEASPNAQTDTVLQAAIQNLVGFR